ncbi:MAG: PBP1A family penicillin-binding protein [Clostridia bacterium]|nr:PBP1A family penicillin-binding protein [Clostridia bacterium]
MNSTVKRFLLIFSITLGIGILLIGILFAGAIFGLWGSSDIDVEGLTLHQNTSLVYLDRDTGEEREFDSINAEQDRVWVDLEDTPKHLQNAFVAIEDERFYEHKGYDLKRTTKATLTWIGKKLIGKGGAASLGGSTITQQLIKNVTGDTEQTAARKIQEISRAAALEKKMEKDEILELYLNCIYLSQGINGVQTASQLYFDKDVKDLSLAECASIAGITQYPSLYDPFTNPDKNKERQEIVLGKMLELNYISQKEYETAKAEPLNFVDPDKKQAETTTPPGTTSYFVDQVIRDVLRDLKEKGYSESLANKMLYSGGLKIYTTYQPEVQKALENYYVNTSNFPNDGIQSAMAVTDVQTGAVVGIVGGIGEKPGSLTLNRATSPRQPGSTIKPIGVYAPAIEKGLITPSSVYVDKATSYGDWVPRNYDHSYRGSVNVRSALRSSLNTIPVEILNKMGAQESYDFLTEKLGITTLVKSRKIDGKIYSDIGLSQLALGGLTDGVTAVEMAAAFSAFANNGVYHTPYTYTEVKDKDGNVILTSNRESWQAMEPSTAFVMHKMLQEVVTSGTGGGAGISGYQTAGKTGTTSDNNDRWFVGYTPHYAAAVWYGYDIPKEISVSGNPCIPVFRNVMNTIHKEIDPAYREIKRPSNVISLSYCPMSGKQHTEECPTEPESFYFIKGNTPGACTSNHEGFVPPEEEDGTEGGEGTEGEGTTETDAPTASGAPSTTPSTSTPSNPPALVE